MKPYVLRFWGTYLWLMPFEYNDFQQFPNEWFVETGTHVGTGVQEALDAGFQNILSIEVSKDLHNTSSKRFRGNDKVKLILGDSGKVLFDSIKDIKVPITFWLDGHASAGTGRGAKRSPLIEELEQIERHPIKTHTILIDDVRSFEIHNINKNTVMKLIRRINPDYEIAFFDSYVEKNDVLVATLNMPQKIEKVPNGKSRWCK